MGTVFAFLVLICLWLIAISYLLWWQLKNLKSFTSGTDKKDLASLLTKILKDNDLQIKKTADLEKVVTGIKKDSQFYIQKIGLVRFNPFSTTGGNQSFCLALLDGEGNGLVISSLHSRDQTRIYAKPIKKSNAAGYELSTEEAQAIKNARRIK